MAKKIKDKCLQSVISKIVEKDSNTTIRLEDGKVSFLIIKDLAAHEYTWFENGGVMLFVQAVGIRFTNTDAVQATLLGKNRTLKQFCDMLESLYA